MPNMGRIIAAHNSKILREEKVKEAEQEASKEPQEQAEQQYEAPKKRGRKPRKEKTNCSCKANGESCPLASWGDSALQTN